MVRVKQISNKKKPEEIRQEIMLKAKRDEYKAEISGEKRKKAHHKRRYLILDEIKYYQLTTENLILKKPFQRLVKEILHDIQIGKTLHPLHRMSCKAICILQEMAESHLVNLMNDSVACALHANRRTVFPRDLDLVLRLSPQY